MLRLLQSHRVSVSRELNRLRFHWGTRTAREEEESRNIGAVERDGDEEVVVAVAVGKSAGKVAKPLLLSSAKVVDWDSLPDDLLRRVGELVNLGTMPPLHHDDQDNDPQRPAPTEGCSTKISFS